MVAFAQAAEHHPIFQGERDIALMEAEMETICLPPPPRPPMPALDTKIAPPPPQQHPVNRKGKALVRTAEWTMTKVTLRPPLANHCSRARHTAKE